MFSDGDFVFGHIEYDFNTSRIGFEVFRFEGEQTSFYDLFRIESAMIVEHWDTAERVAPKSEWQNDNGKF